MSQMHQSKRRGKEQRSRLETGDKLLHANSDRKRESTVYGAYFLLFYSPKPLSEIKVQQHKAVG